MPIIVGLLLLFGLFLIFPGFAAVLVVVVGAGLALGVLGTLLAAFFHSTIKGGPK